MKYIIIFVSLLVFIISMSQGKEIRKNRNFSKCNVSTLIDMANYQYHMINFQSKLLWKSSSELVEGPIVSQDKSNLAFYSLEGLKLNNKFYVVVILDCLNGKVRGCNPVNYTNWDSFHVKAWSKDNSCRFSPGQH
ncbi:MAG: hypothetical protein KAQ98_14275, partial [Bacteriovoracaceae bacterium]|nr:hypothetical protein [Bacteriovoracaceae bacterium]